MRETDLRQLSLSFAFARKNEHLGVGRIHNEMPKWQSVWGQQELNTGRQNQVIDMPSSRLGRIKYRYVHPKSITIRQLVREMAQLAKNKREVTGIIDL